VGDGPMTAEPNARPRPDVGPSPDRTGWQPTRQSAALATAVAGVALIVGGLALAYPPAGLIAAGVALLLALTFDPSRLRRLTWPR
jgi:hypothetical protein